MKNLIAVCLLALASVGTAFASADPCLDNQLVKKHAFANITTATTTSLVAVPANPAQQIVVCSIVAQVASTTTASTVLFESGTGAACSSPTALTATYTSGNAGGNVAVQVSASGTVLTVAAGSGLCALTTVGSTPTTAVDVVYVLQ
jgi:hypothetical protein